MARLADKIREKVVLPIAYYLLRDRRFALLEELLARDAWTPQQIRTYQGQRLGSLLRVAQEHNPYWREKFKTFGVHANGSDPFAEIAKLPILTKDEMRANWKQMRSTHLGDHEMQLETSSGSTGMQINLYHSKVYRRIHAAMQYRSRAWMGVQPGEPYLAIQSMGPSPKFKRRVLRQFRAMLEKGYFIDAIHIDPADVKQHLARAAKTNPVHVYGYTTSVVTVAQLSLEEKMQWPSVRAVSTTSEQLLPPDREMLGKAFDAPVYDRYGSREVLNVSMQCAQGKHHIYADLNYVEFAPLEDAEDDMQAIIITPLDNEAMPLFRYRSGDSAAAVEGTCSCGRHLPLMTGCRGRICNNFITPDGKIVSGAYFTFYFYYQEGFRAYQFHQTSPEHIDLYVVPQGTLTDERRAYLDNSCKKIREDHGNLFDVQLHIVDQIPRTPGGKHLYTISDVLRHI